MSDQLPKPLKQLREQIGAYFSKIDKDPNHWTAVSLVVAVAAAVFVGFEQFITGAILIALSGFFDWVDGAVARHVQKVTKKGAYLDTISDRYTEFLYLFPLFIIALPGIILPSKAWIALYLFGAMATTYAKAAAKEKELGIPEIRGGIIERAERVSLLTIGILLAAFDVYFLSYMVAILAVLANVSALQRIKKTLDALQPAPVAAEKKVEEEQTTRVVFEKKGKEPGEKVELPKEEVKRRGPRIKI
jgi:archaetidylinositol phosphate synthase